MNSGAPIEPAARRASDADRERVAQALGDAFATGSLSDVEHAERLDAAFAARTVGELEPLTWDLPVRRTGPASPPAPRRSTAVFSKLRRHGRWVLPAETRALSVFGTVVLDLRGVEFPPDGAVTVTASSVFGKVELYVPKDAQVYDDGTALFGKRTLPGGGPEGAGGPMIHIRGRSVFGKIHVHR